MEEQGVYGGRLSVLNYYSFVNTSPNTDINYVVLLIDVTTDEWNFYILPLDDDILSLELPEFFRDNFLVMLFWMLSTSLELRKAVVL